MFALAGIEISKHPERHCADSPRRSRGAASGISVVT